MFAVNSLSCIVNNSFLDKSLIIYDQVIEEDRILIEKNLKNLFSLRLPTGEVSRLNGGKSGDSLYLGRFGTRKLVIRIMAESASKAFDKQLSYSQMAAQKQLGPDILYHNVEDRISITEFIEGTSLLPSLLDDQYVLLQLTLALHDIHHSERFHQDEYNIFKIIEQKLKNFIQKNNLYSSKLLEYSKYIQDINTAIRKRNLISTPCHNDVHMGNVFYDQNQNIKFIDWGDAGLGDLFFDLARASIEFHFSKDQTEKFLNAYFSGNVSLVDRAHFFLMQHLALLQQGLLFLDLSHLDESTKDLVASYFKKNEIEVDINNIHFPQDVSKIIFNLFEQRILSKESKQALLTLKRL